MATVKFDDLDNALEFVNPMFENAAYISRETGQIVWVSPDLDPEESDVPPADELEDGDKYIPVPEKRDLDLGTVLVFDFIEAELPQHDDEVRAMFRGRGAYRRFSEFLAKHDRVDQWHQFQNRRQRQALQAWCEDVGIRLVD